MPVNTKTIKRRIKSIGSTKKITKAMEMISAVKMRRAVGNVLATRNYSNLAWEMLSEIAKKTDLSQHSLLAVRPVKRIAVILITSNRGLAGGFGSRLLQATHSYINKVQHGVILNEAQRSEESLSQSQNGQRSFANAQDDSKGITVDIILTGRQGKKIYHKFGHNVVAEFDKLDLTTHIEEILPMTQMAIADYISGKYDAIVVAYTDFVSALLQTPKLKQILPIVNADAEENNTPPPQWRGQGEDSSDQIGHYLFEPSTKDVLNLLLPRLIEMQIYQAILESDASEHSARMMAMRSASDAAEDMIKELNYSFNKARQAAITQEISEIVGGAAALG